MNPVEIFVTLTFIVAALALVARRSRIPYPIVFVLGGSLFSLIPALPQVRLEPEIVFLIFMPPLLYIQAMNTTWRDFKFNLRPITSLAVGLVLVTTTAVAYVAHAIMPWLPFAACFVLGAIVSPPDAVAASAIARQVGLPRRMVTILEGESLVNDATGLVAYRFAIGAVVYGMYSLWKMTFDFFFVAIGGILAGLLIGWVIAQIRRRIDDVSVQVTLSLITPFAIYCAAERLQVSGVLAVVAAGIYLSWVAPEIVSFSTRMQAEANWNSMEFAMNGYVFLLIGLQLPSVLTALDQYSAFQLFWYALVISGAVILIRPLFVFPMSYLSRLVSKSLRQKDPLPSFGTVAVISWSGMRGVVSLAIALSIPDKISNGQPFPGRDLIIFISFCVILATLVFQGLTLPAVIRWFHLAADDKLKREEKEARIAASRAALAHVEQVASEGGWHEEAIILMRSRFEDRIAQLTDELAMTLGWSHQREKAISIKRLLRQVIRVQRKTVIELRRNGQIGDEVLHKLEHEFDLEEARLT